MGIAARPLVATSSVSLWMRDVQFEPRQRRGGETANPNALQRRKAAEIAALREEGQRRLAGLTDRELLVTGTALYAGEGAKNDGVVKFANSDPGSSPFTAHGFDSSSPSTSLVSASRSTCTRASTSTPRLASGRE